EEARAFVLLAHGLVLQRSWDEQFFARFRKLFPLMHTQATAAARDVARLVAVNAALRHLSPFPARQLGPVALATPRLPRPRPAACAPGEGNSSSGGHDASPAAGHRNDDASARTHAAAAAAVGGGGGAGIDYVAALEAAGEAGDDGAVAHGGSGDVSWDA